jgi:tetratricopeptide (TPR) repeat protein
LDKVLYLIILSAMFVFPFNVESQTKHTTEWMHEAIQASIKGDFEKAKRIFHAILNTNSNNIYALNNLGKIYLDSKEFEQAINLTKKAWKLNPKFYMAGNTLGDAYKQNGEIEKAETILKQVIEVNPKFELAYLNLGEVYFLQKRYDDAEKLLKKALSLMPEIKRPKIFLEKIIEAKNK